MKVGLISGHRIPRLLKKEETVTVETRYGEIPIGLSPVGNHTILFINRHGKDAKLPPHKVNYLGIIEALAASHVECILAIGTVGSLRPQMRPGEFIIPHDFIDFTKTRRYTFFDEQRVHVDMTNPYCPAVRACLIHAATTVPSAKVHDHGVYLATEGPRLETAAEIKFFSQYSDVVGMTGVPEVVLAREKGLCYASLCLISNMATGLQSELLAEEIAEMYTEKQPLIADLLGSTIQSLETRGTCTCRHGIAQATL